MIFQGFQPEFMVYGDLGIHSESMAHLHLDAMRGIYSAVLHVGDFGYNLYDTVPDGQFAGKNVSALVPGMQRFKLPIEDTKY